MKTIHQFLKVFILVAVCACTGKETSKSYSPASKVCNLPASAESMGNYFAPSAEGIITIDGMGMDSSWNKAPWKDIKYNWSGSDYSSQDFQGRYKILWKDDQLYFLAEIVDNILSNKNKNPLDKWWEDDGLEIMLLEEKSENHLHQKQGVITYHIGLDNHIVITRAGERPYAYHHEVKVQRTKKGNLNTWEVAVEVHPHKPNGIHHNGSMQLQEGNILGYALGYTDNDGSAGRENYIGSISLVGSVSSQRMFDSRELGTLELIR